MAGKRPLGVTLLAALYILGGIVCILFGIGAGVLGTALLGAVGSAIGGVLGGVVVIIGLVEFAVAYGFLKGMKWSWWVAMVLYVLGLILSIVAIATGSIGAIVGLIIDAILIYYMTRPAVKTWFGMK